jgi:hypothetical protein
MFYRNILGDYSGHVFLQQIFSYLLSRFGQERKLFPLIPDYLNQNWSALAYFSKLPKYQVYDVTWRLKAGIVEPQETFCVRQRFGKHVPAATNTQVTTDELLGKADFCWVRSEERPRQGSQTRWGWLRESWGLVVLLSSARETEKRWRYSRVDSWQLR